MFCIDPSKFDIRGDTYSPSSKNLVISFNIPEAECRDSEYDLECVTTRAFQETLANKDIFTFYNRVRFVADGYGDGTHIIKETVLEWYEFPKITTVRNFLIKEEILVREDNLLM